MFNGFLRRRPNFFPLADAHVKSSFHERTRRRRLGIESLEVRQLLTANFTGVNPGSGDGDFATTSPDSFVLEGAANPNDLVTITAISGGNVTIGSTMADAAGNWGFFVMRADGVHRFRAQDSDATSDDIQVTVNSVDLGNLAWESRNEQGNLVDGTTYKLTPNPFSGVGAIAINDNGMNDEDNTSGQIQISGVLPAEYTVQQITAANGYALDGNVTRSQTVNATNLNAVIGSGIPGPDDPGDGDESDFHVRLGSLEWEKRDSNGILLSGAEFDISPDPILGNGGGTLVIIDNGVNDADPRGGKIRVENVFLDSYTITETSAPAGFDIDGDPTREVIVSDADLYAVIGTQGQNDSGVTDESDFHHPLASMLWENRDSRGALLGGATFEVSPNPLIDSVVALVVVDNGPQDQDPTWGQFQVDNVRMGAFTVTETIAPAGYARDQDPDRIVIVSETEPEAVIGTQGQNDPGVGDEVDFHNRLGSMAWENRDNTGMLLGGATFEIAPDPVSDSLVPLVVLDNGPLDDDPTVGQLQIQGARLGDYTITQTIAPSGYGLDSEPIRRVTVSELVLNAAIGIQGEDDLGNDPVSSDFHNRLGSLSWEKRDHAGMLLGGATFEVSPNPLTGGPIPLVMVDNGPHDRDPDDGELLIEDLRLDTYRVTETIAPTGYARDDDPDRVVTVSEAVREVTIGVMGQDDPGNDDTSDFHNRLGMLEWEKRDDTSDLQGKAKFEITPDPFTGSGSLVVADNDANDMNKSDGQFRLIEIRLDTYIVEEIEAPPGFAKDTDVDREATVSEAELNVTIGIQGQDDLNVSNPEESDFHNQLGNVAWEKRDKMGMLLGGATFEVLPNPLTGALTPLVVVDDGPHDADKNPGELLINDVMMDTYTVTETIPPTGYALDDDSDRIVTVSETVLNATIGVHSQDDLGNSDNSDFHNRLGMLAWEKRDDTGDLQGWAQFTVTPNPFTGIDSLLVVDNDSYDMNESDGQFQLIDVRLGTYIVEEVQGPIGFAKDRDVDREVTISSAELTVVIGVQNQDDTIQNTPNPEERDFHNQLGSLAWEKRDNMGALQGGATFEVSPNPLTGSTTPLVLIDDGPHDWDPDPGEILIDKVRLGTYTVTETIAPTGFALDDDVDRIVTVGETVLDVTIGTMGQDDLGNHDTSDFHNRLGNLEWEKRDPTGGLQANAKFEILPDPFTGTGSLIVADNDANDRDQDGGQFKLINVRVNTYLVTEVEPPPGYALDGDIDREVTVSEADLHVVIGVQGQDDNSGANPEEFDFHNQLGSLSWEKRDERNALLGGATFEVSPNPLTSHQPPLVVVDNGQWDADDTPGQITVENCRLGDYTITETLPPPGFARDDRDEREISVTTTVLNAVVGVQGQDDSGDSDESDFHNILGSLSWEKRDHTGGFHGSATFRVTPDPHIAGNRGFLDVTDNDGIHDMNNTVGKFLLHEVYLATYIVEEIVAPDGFARDVDRTREETVSEVELAAQIGIEDQDDLGTTDESDFHNRLGSLAWEKRDNFSELQGDATFEITPNPFTGDFSVPLMVIDDDVYDVDTTAGQIQLDDVRLGDYTIKEIISPLQYRLDDDVTRQESVTEENLNAVVGHQDVDDSGDSDESDFHNRLGSLAWEKRDHEGRLLGGATFLIEPDPFDQTSHRTIQDNDPDDVDQRDGRVQIINVLLDDYTITETKPPPGFARDFDLTRRESVTKGNMNAEVGQKDIDDLGNTDESDFHNRLGTIEWEKRDTDGNLRGGAVFIVSPNPQDGDGNLKIKDNDLNDADPTPGQFKLTNVLLNDYTIKENSAPAGFKPDVVIMRSAEVTEENLYYVVGVQGRDDEEDFHNEPSPALIVTGSDKGVGSEPFVTVINTDTDEVLSHFLAYDSGYEGGIRVATGDLDCDGIDEIVTAPGRAHPPEIRVFTQQGVEMEEFRFLAYDASFTGGVHVAVGDVDGDGMPDIVTSPSLGRSDIKVFRNGYVLGEENDDAIDEASPYLSFMAFSPDFLGGSVVRVADIGTFNNGQTVDSRELDGVVEIMVGSGPTMWATVNVYDVSSTPTVVRSFHPFSSRFRGGVSLDVKRVDDRDLIPDMIVGAGNRGRSLVQVLDGRTGQTLTNFIAYHGNSNKAPVRVTGRDTNVDGIADQIMTTQGPDGSSEEIRSFDALTGGLVDRVFASDPGTVGAFFVDAIQRADYVLL